VTALALLSHCAGLGVKLVLEGEDRITLEGPKAARDSVREAVRAVKPEVLALLRAHRQTVVSNAYSEAFARIAQLYPDDLIGRLWSRITTDHPALARSIDMAEMAADGAALAFQAGAAPDSSVFLACLESWESTWREAITVASGTTCDDCGKATTVLVLTDYGCRFCRDCLRPEPLGLKPKGMRHDA
jgi:hypothetical protein